MIGWWICHWSITLTLRISGMRMRFWQTLSRGTWLRMIFGASYKVLTTFPNCPSSKPNNFLPFLTILVWIFHTPRRISTQEGYEISKRSRALTTRFLIRCYRSLLSKGWTPYKPNRGCRSRTLSGGARARGPIFIRIVGSDRVVAARQV